jgi:CubicO group peptidase (beta-lactamase class C family)
MEFGWGKVKMNTYKRLMSLFIIIILAAYFAAACAQTPTQPTAQVIWPAENWQSSSPEAQGMDSALLVQMFETIQEDDIRLHSLLVVRNGNLVAEAYWEPYGLDDKHTIESNTKSVIGSLVGIANDQGLIAGAGQKMLDFFAGRPIEKMDDQKKAITLGNLLSMTPGLSCQDLSSAGQGLFRAGDRVQYLLDLPVTDPPGRRWIYCSGAAHLLSAVLQQATGVDARTYANIHLFGPLGIPEVEAQDWGADPQGVTNGVAGLYLTPRDLAKFGYLYLNQGNWNGRQVVPEKWVEESTREQAYIGQDDYVGGLDRRFGYLWSLFPNQGYYGYLGMAGQELFIVPEKQLVIVFNGSLEVGKEAALLRLINDYIIPAARSEAALPADPQGDARLKALIESAAGSKQPVPALPQTALDITGKTFALESNPLGWPDMTFSFQPGSDVATLEISGSPALAIGLDGQYRLTESPVSRPVGLKGYWDTPNSFVLQHILLGEFPESLGRVEFAGERMTLSIKSLNYAGPALVIRGKLKKSTP